MVNHWDYYINITGFVMCNRGSEDKGGKKRQRKRKSTLVRYTKKPLRMPVFILVHPDRTKFA
jgi:hypothetical protein